MAHFDTLPGETPIDDISGLRIRGIATRAELNKAEATNIQAAVTGEVPGTPAYGPHGPLDYSWSLSSYTARCSARFGNGRAACGSVRI